MFYLNTFHTYNQFEAQGSKGGNHDVSTDPMGTWILHKNLRIRFQESGSVTIHLHYLWFVDPDRVRIRVYAHLHFLTIIVSISSFNKIHYPVLITKIDNSCISFRVWTFRTVRYAVKKMRCKSGSMDPDRPVRLRPGTIKSLVNTVRHSKYGSYPETGPAFCAGPVRVLIFVLPSAWKAAEWPDSIPAIENRTVPNEFEIVTKKTTLRINPGGYDRYHSTVPV